MLFLSSCENPNKNEQTTQEVTAAEYVQPKQQIKIGYTTTDSLNPYFAETTMNTKLTDLVFSRLFTLDDTYKPTGDLALEGAVEGLEVEVILKNGLSFSDGSQLSAEDVRYSFDKAKNCPQYKDKLANFASCTAETALTLKLSLYKPDEYCLNLLDFPVVKTGTAENREDITTGSGSYLYIIDAQSGEISLLHNKFSIKPLPEIGKIKLVDIDDTSTLAYKLETGVIDSYYSDLNKTMINRPYATLIPVFSNNFLFLGVNSSNASLSSAKLRAALSRCINREEVCESAYRSNALPSYSVFNPKWHIFANSVTDFSSRDLNYSAAITVFDELGYTNITSGGIRSGNIGRLSFKLIVNAENEFKVAAAEIIAQSMKKGGININVTRLSENDFRTAVRDNAYDFYIGEVKIPMNMDFSAVFTKGAAASGGINENSTIFESFSDYSNNTLTLEAFDSAFLEQMPVIPLCYKNSLLFVRKSITADIRGAVNDIFASINTWKMPAPENETTAVSVPDSEVII